MIQKGKASPKLIGKISDTVYEARLMLAPPLLHPWVKTIVHVVSRLIIMILANRESRMQHPKCWKMMHF